MAQDTLGSDCQRSGNDAVSILGASGTVLETFRNTTTKEMQGFKIYFNMVVLCATKEKRIDMKTSTLLFVLFDRSVLRRRVSQTWKLN